MKTPSLPKNLVNVDGVLKYRRWTILWVDSDVVNTVKSYASKHGYTTSRALKELVLRGAGRGD